MEIRRIYHRLCAQLPRRARHFAPLLRRLNGEILYSVPKRRTPRPPQHLRGPEPEYKF